MSGQTSKGEERIKLLDEDWKQIRSGEPFPIGSTTLNIIAFSWNQLDALSLKIEAVVLQCISQGLTRENFHEVGNLFMIAKSVLEKGPEIVSEASNLDVADVRELPLPILSNLVSKIIEVNAESKESLVKNLKALRDLLPMDQESEQENDSLIPNGDSET